MLPALIAAVVAWPLPRNGSVFGIALDAHLRLNLSIALALLVAAHVLILAGMIFRRGMPRRTSMLALEYLSLAALVVLFAWLAMKSNRLWAEQRYTGASPAAMQVEVTGMQFAWYFRYPGHDKTFGRTDVSLIDAPGGNPLGIDSNDAHGKDDVVTSALVLPAGREVDLALRSLDVIHGFSVPEMRLKQNTVPGQTMHIHFTPAVPGTYAILCTQVCGMGHYRMTSTLRVLPAAEFDKWLASEEAQP
jgi:cytochrome c oxidase subunit 2